MAMVGAMRESGGLPMPDPDGPPPTNPCNLADAAPDGPLGDALRAAGFADVTAEEWTYPVCVAGRDFADVAAISAHLLCREHCVQRELPASASLRLGLVVVVREE